MKLSDWFTGENSITGADKSQTGNIRPEQGGRVDLSRPLGTFAPGQSIKGEIISKNGGKVQIKLPEGRILQARVDQSMNLEAGRVMTFEVKSSARTLTLTPLFTNVAMDENVLKALAMASLPVNEETVSMTRQLMEAAFSIDKNTLQQLYREMNAFPQAETSDIISLHRLHLPVNDKNLAQAAAHRNLSYQLTNGVHQVLDALSEPFSNLIETGNIKEAAGLYRELLFMVQEMAAGSGNSGEEAVLSGSFSKGMGIFAEILAGSLEHAGEELGMFGGNAGNVQRALPEMLEALGSVPNGFAVFGEEDPGALESLWKDFAGGMQHAGRGQELLGDNAGNTSGSLGNGLAGGMEIPGKGAIIFTENPEVQNADKAGNALGIPLENVEDPSGKAGKQFQTAWGSTSSLQGRLAEGLEKLLKPLLQLFKQQWTITPEEAGVKENVDALYHRLAKQLQGLAEALEHAGQTEGAAYKAVKGLTGNLDFLQQVNQTYTYVQLPLRLNQREAHGDLYVYTNKKHLAAGEGQISALLHLDMEHLGPVDVYVTMAGEGVNTRFYVQDDAMLDFLMGHMELLTKRLKVRGYRCSCEMQVREEKDGPQNCMERLLKQEHALSLAEYSFDVRT